ncbi:hypothetical protein LJC34_01970 [Oscillospiraceae bacterium OttesenSCG-928-G22]|nr:hypothetical protein [Oscillospiraceae bacterium OttesenSCG-928-G22]
MNRISLAERLGQLDKGINVQEQNIAIITEMANMYIDTYLAAFEDEMHQLLELVGIAPQQAKFQSVCDIARRVEMKELDWEEKNEAVKILALPFQRFCAERIRK